MKIRTQLMLAFLALSVLPLSGIVLYSYFTSLKAVRTAYEADAAQNSSEMHQRMAQIRDDLNSSIADVGQLPLETLFDQQSGGQSKPMLRKMVLQKLGKNAKLIRSFQYVPANPPAAAKAPEAGHPAAVPAPPHVPIVVNVEQIIRDAEAGVRFLPPEERGRVLERMHQQLRKVPGAIQADRSDGSDADPDLGELPAPAEATHPEEAAAAAAAAEERSNAVREAERAATASRAEAQKSEAAKLVLHGHAGDVGFGHDLEVPIWSAGAMIGSVHASLSGREILDRVLGASELQEGEVAFAVDQQGKLYTAREEDRARLSDIPLAVLRTPTERIVENWVIASNRDQESGLTYGIARPIRRPLEQVRRTAARNFTYGIGLIFLALFGIVPIANHMTRDVHAIAAGAERIAQGDLETRVPVRSSNEFGHLAESFNRMARDLSEHQARLLEEERLRREQELSKRLLEIEYARKSTELEDARAFQLSLLPKVLPDHPGFKIDVFMRTAAEVGGDYYDFHHDADGTLTIVAGDATGHGARAATMVTVIKSLFAAYTPDQAPAQFLSQANETVKRMQLGRMAMGLTLARFEKGLVTLSAAGMPPVFIRRGDGSVEEVELSGMPLGTLSQSYPERQVRFASGDMFLILSDGFPERANVAGEPFGYEGVSSLLARANGKPAEVIETLVAAADEWGGGEPQSDDITFVVIQVV